MIYCISDIHGCYDEFIELIEKIELKYDDVLYILGDVIDRGNKVVECLKYIKSHPQIIMLMGNHEHMMINYYENQKKHWHRDGGIETQRQMEESYTEDEIVDLLDWIETLPYFKIVTINEKSFFLSHAGINITKSFAEQECEDYISGRDEFFNQRIKKTLFACSLKDSYYYVFGHTPTLTIHEDGSFFVWFDKANNDKVCIDCGCVFGGMLAALRLDDMIVFYVESKK